MADGAAAPKVRMGTPAGRWVVAATVLGSGIAFLDGTVVNVALPAISRNLHGGIAGLQWTLDAYLITLTALMLLGGSLGDLFGRRRVFVAGLAGFGAVSALCGAAPTIGVLIAGRALQGVAGALLVPSSLSILSATFHPEDRARAVGAWSGLAGISSAVGPFLGGWLVDIGSWRYVFLINLPLAAAAVAIALRHVPETRESAAGQRVDIPGAMAATLGLAGACYAVIEGARHFSGLDAAAGVVGGAALIAFVLIEGRRPSPMLPLNLFRSRQFSGANLVTLAVYAGLGVTFFLVVLELQIGLHYSALAAGVSLLPVTGIMLALSARFGALAQRTGPRLPMTAGPVIVGAGLLWLSRVAPGSHYVSTVMPALAVFGFGLAMTVAPLTAAVLAAVDDHHVGVGSAVNNAVSRLAGLLSVAVLPAVVGLQTGSAALLGPGYREAMVIAAGLSAAGGIIALVTIRRSVPVSPTTQASVGQCCHPPEVAHLEPAA
ncbi:MAG TPA: MFS transporter [Actinomycetota bacterium]|nr:MFS transporter [Actinomycetota bacterium]